MAKSEKKNIPRILQTLILPDAAYLMEVCKKGLYVISLQPNYLIIIVSDFRAKAERAHL